MPDLSQIKFDTPSLNPGLDGSYKLNDYVVNASRQTAAAGLDALNESMPSGTLAALNDVINKLLMKGDTLSPVDAAKLPGEILKALGDSWKDKPPPAWLLLPIILLITAGSGLKSILDMISITNEKNILQPLRKALRPGLLDESTSIQAGLRGLLKDEKVKDKLAALGYTDEDITLLMQTALYIPTAQDIVFFAVREVYNESVVSAFQQDDKLDQVLTATAEDRKAAGLTDAQFSKFWLAHWELPSVNQGIEAFQRGLIDQDKLNMLFQAKDVMPYWRDVLRGIAYNLLTRVDVRRMHKLGLFTEQEVTAQYVKMGHSPEDAAKLTQFTVAYNKAPEAQDKTDADVKKEKERDLTAGQITQAYNSGTLDGGRAKAYLSGLGYNGEEIDLLLARVDATKTQQYTDKLIDGYHDIYIKGLIAVEDLKTYLAGIPVSPDRQTQLIALWDVERMAKLDMPTKADILSWLKKSIIQEPEARDLLSAIGTQEPFLTYYIKGVK